MNPSPLIVANQLTLVANKKRILDDLTFEIEKGSFMVVIGENGAGKTTLIGMLTGVAQPTSGSVLVRGLVPHLAPPVARRKIVYLAERMSPPTNWSVEEYFAFNRYFYQDYDRNFEKELADLFAIRLDMRVGYMSAGQLRRMQVVAGLATLPDLVFVDEITAVLDIVGRVKFLDVLKTLRNRTEATIVMGTNIVDDIDTYATHVMLLHDGKMAKLIGREALFREYQGGSRTEVFARMIEGSTAAPAGGS